MNNFGEDLEEIFYDTDEDADATMVFDINTALKMIPAFSGDRNELNKFISCSDVVATLATTRADQTLLLNVIKSKLSGSAYNLIKYKTYTDWDGLKKILQDQYLEKRTVAQLQTQLISSRQYPSEDIRSFANRLERTLLDLNDACIASEGNDAATIIQNLNNKTALRAFVEGLNEPIRLIIKASRFTTLNAAVEAACEEERSRPKTRTSEQKSSNITCYKCKRTGHRADKCFSNNTSNAGSNLPRYPNHTAVKRESNVNVAQVTCAYCKKNGHHISECRKRQYNNSKSQSAPSNSEQNSENEADKRHFQ